MQIKLNEEFSDEELNLINSSYIGVRLISVDKGTLERFSLIYARTSEKSAVNKEYINISIRKLIDDSKKTHAAQVEASNPSVTQPTLNKLIRTGFNKSSLLVDEKTFLEHEMNLHGSEGNRTPIGFVQNNGFTLVSGKCGGNAFVVTSAIIELIQYKSRMWKESKKRFDPTIVEYRTPSCGLMIKKARIKHFFQN